MLILTRSTGETVMIGNEESLSVMGVDGDSVRLGINASKSVPVEREEVYERIKRELQGDLDDNRPESAPPRDSRASQRDR